MKKRTIKKMITTIVLLFLSSTAIAENVITEDEKKWNPENERTIITAPELSIDDSFLYIYSEQQLDNVTISIQDANGDIIYSTVTTIPACQIYSIPISSLNNGEYTFSLYNGNKYILANILIDN